MVALLRAYASMETMSVRSPENILLHLPEEQDAYVREIFAEIGRRDLPNPGQRPHISVTFAQQMSPAVVDLAAELLPTVIPTTLRRVGTVVFGTRSKQTIAWLLEADPELHKVAAKLSEANPEGRGPMWIPHLTVGLRVPKQVVPRYLETLADVTSSHFKEIRVDRASFWRPSVQQERILAE